MPRDTNKHGDKLGTLFVQTLEEDLKRLDAIVHRQRTNRSVYIRNLLRDHLDAVEEAKSA